MLAEEMVSSSTSVSHENDASEVTFFRAALGDLARRLEID
jgi:hypothetical protein